MTEIKNPGFFYGYIIVLAGFLIMVLSWGAIRTFGVFLKPMSMELGWTRAMTSGAYSAELLLHGLLYILTGRLNDRLGPRVVMTACGLFTGLGYLLMSQVQTIWQLYLFYSVIVAVGISGAFVPLTSTVARWFDKNRGMMTGLVVSGMGFGVVIMPPIASWVITGYGWRSSYLVVGVSTLVLIVLAAQFLRRDPGKIGQVISGERAITADRLSLQTAGLSLVEAINTRQFWMLCAVYLCNFIGQHAVVVHIVPHVTDLGISPAIAANVLAVIGGVSIAGMMVMSSVSDRIGNRSTLTINFVIFAASLLWLLFTREVWAFFLFAVIFGFGFGGLVAMESLMVAGLFGLKSHGMILGMVIFVATLGGAFSAFAAGRIFDVVGSYQLAFLAIAALGVIGLILALMLRPARKEV